MKLSERNFQGIWIPRIIYLNPEVNWYAKILFLEIHSFTENGRECYMSNKYIASFLHISERQVTRYISELKSMGWIAETSFNGRKRYLKSLLHFGPETDNPAPTKVSGQPRLNCPGSIDKSVYHTKQEINQETKQFTFLKEKNRSPILE
ncbi:helix-turn-helix domain-containing protein [Pareuzebyella sediminis]|uniref:helix-turn-helix domain-containing protein n=1 Tax=Pareuzebyella sediminis TaxID=2607998 RepID=UPI0011EE3232|nr:helix-turn-helix domain-containing protein [Pareuzebyella sediminis]